ncbi:formylglycine-generating enzyme family protein [Candidatus Uabimicrobium amorphum]|nr:formylglycine-generating enzyme family protein [Candidatus Uabimicrobium amorphum]
MEHAIDKKIVKGKSLQEVQPHTKYMACTFYLDYVDGEDLQGTEFDNCSFRGAFRDWGRDTYGLWMAISYKNIRQVMRWIRPGTFIMGSPSTEMSRQADETQHKVIISKGFWLAETACTQELWKAVTGWSGSSFAVDNCPADDVNWDDCQTFINKWNSEMVEWELCFPTEAQWEYACRAGTTTAFSFGDNIAKDQVNYDLKRTAAVKSRPCNDWGLYEMHGNVCEWCEDWYGEYDSTVVMDPVGPSDGTDRVMRGGCCSDSSGNVRSAARYKFWPNENFGEVGFRFCLRSKK